MRTFLRKVGLMGVTFFVANAIASIVSLVILFTRSRRETVPEVLGRCPVCGAGVSDAAKYCPACGSRL